MAVTQPTRTFQPRWPDPATVDPERVRFTYWAEVDTLHVDFADTEHPAVAVPVDLGDGDRDYLFLKLDPVTEAVVGLQVEDILSYAVGRNPGLLDVLDLADLHGISLAEVAEARRRVAARTRRAAVRSIFDQFALPTVN
jgi:hypothetical protein